MYTKIHVFIYRSIDHKQGNVIVSTEAVRQMFDARDTVGESIVWDETSSSLVWIDIIGQRIHRLALASCKHQIWQTPSMVTSIGLRADGGTVVGLTKHIALWDFDDDFRMLASIESDLPDNRLNEGVVGPDGALWVGTMKNNVNEDGSAKAVTESTGHIYRVSSDGYVQKMSNDAFGIPNTMAWTANNRFIIGDTLENTLYSYAINASNSALHNRQVWSTGFHRGLPDGSCMDAEGYLWNCRVVGGACLIRIAPDGTVDRLIELPCKWPTSCCFGGDDLTQLFVTSARFTMSADHLAQNPHEGALFMVEPGVTGCLSNRLDVGPGVSGSDY